MICPKLREKKPKIFGIKVIMLNWLKEVFCWHKWTDWIYFGFDNEFKIRACVKCGKEEQVEEGQNGADTDKK